MQVDPIKPKLKSPGTKSLTLNSVVLLSNFAFEFNLRRYNEVEGDARQRGVSSSGGVPAPLPPGGQQGGRPGPPPNISPYSLPNNSRCGSLNNADVARHVISCQSTQYTRVHNACR